jgi:Zn-dependent peptidase ImmA (M78 family)
MPWTSPLLMCSTRGWAVATPTQKKHDRKIANDFAAHVLMPTALVKHVWSATGDLSLAAAAFNVSVEEMETRLEKLNLIGKPTPIPRGYFREPVSALTDHLDDMPHQAA